MKMQMLLPVLLVVLSSGSVSSMNDDDVHTMLRNALHKAVPEGAAHNGKASSQFVENLAEMHGPGSTARATMLRSGFADMVPSDEDVRNVQAVKERSNPMASFASDMLASGGVGGIVGAMKDAVATEKKQILKDHPEAATSVDIHEVLNLARRRRLLHSPRFPSPWARLHRAEMLERGLSVLLEQGEKSGAGRTEAEAAAVSAMAVKILGSFTDKLTVAWDWLKEKASCFAAASMGIVQAAAGVVGSLLNNLRVEISPMKFAVSAALQGAGAGACMAKPIVLLDMGKLWPSKKLNTPEDYALAGKSVLGFMGVLLRNVFKWLKEQFDAIFASGSNVMGFVDKCVIPSAFKSKTAATTTTTTTTTTTQAPKKLNALEKLFKKTSISQLIGNIKAKWTEGLAFTTQSLEVWTDEILKIQNGTSKNVFVSTMFKIVYNVLIRPAAAAGKFAFKMQDSFSSAGGKTLRYLSDFASKRVIKLELVLGLSVDIGKTVAVIAGAVASMGAGLAAISDIFAGTLDFELSFPMSDEGPAAGSVAAIKADNTTLALIKAKEPLYKSVYGNFKDWLWGQTGNIVFIGGGTITGYGLAIPDFGAKYCFSMKQTALDLMSFAGEMFMKALTFLVCPSKKTKAVVADPAAMQTGDYHAATEKEAATEGKLTQMLCSAAPKADAPSTKPSPVSEAISELGKGVNGVVSEKKGDAVDMSALDNLPANATPNAAKLALKDGPLKKCMAAGNCFKELKDYLLSLWDAQIVFQVRMSGAEINLNFPIEGGNALKGIIDLLTDFTGMKVAADAIKELLKKFVGIIKSVVLRLIKFMFDFGAMVGKVVGEAAQKVAAKSKELFNEGVDLFKSLVPGECKKPNETCEYKTVGTVCCSGMQCVKTGAEFKCLDKAAAKAACGKVNAGCKYQLTGTSCCDGLTCKSSKCVSK